jgi:hypothetical protein
MMSPLVTGLGRKDLLVGRAREQTPNTAPTPHITRANGCRWRGKVLSRMACPIGMIGAPNSPWGMRARISVSRLLADADLGPEF